MKNSEEFLLFEKLLTEKLNIVLVTDKLKNGQNPFLYPPPTLLEWGIKRHFRNVL